MPDIYRTAREEYYFYLGPDSAEFSPLSSGITFADPNYHILRPNGDHYVFEYVISGRGYVYFNDKKVALGPGAAYILHPCTYHHYYSDPHDPWTKVWLNVRGMLVQHLLSDYHLNTNCYVENFKNRDYLTQAFTIMKKDPAHCRSELALFLHHYIQLFSETLIGHQEKTSPAFAMKCYIEQNVHRSLHIDEISAHVHLSRSRANEVFKRAYSTPPYRYYLSLRLEISMNLLRHSPMTIQEISNHLDFPDYHHFTAFFKKWCGMTPSQYRQKFQLELSRLNAESAASK